MGFGHSPVSDPHCVVKIVRLPLNQVESLIITSDCMEGVQTHFTDRTVICGGDDCSHCFQGRPTRFLGFIVVRWRLGKGLLRLTSGPATQLMGFNPVPGMTLEVLQKNPRSPIKIRRSGFVKVAPQDSMTQLELLNCLSHLFCVGSVDFNDSYEVNRDRLRRLACTQSKDGMLPFPSDSD